MSQREFATIVFADTEREPLYSALKTHPFGSRRAPSNWGRVTTFVKWVMKKVFACVVRIFAEDCFVPEPEMTIYTAYETLIGLCELLGLEIERSKTISPTDRLLLLGADIRIAISEVTASLPEKKRILLAAELRLALHLHFT